MRPFPEESGTAAEARAFWSLAGPGLLLLSLFLALPFLLALGLSFTDQRLLPGPALPTRLVGLRNYVRLATDTDALLALRNNAWFALVVVPLQTALALAMALLVHRRLPGRNGFRLVFFMPVATTLAVVTVVWSLFFAPGPGLVNRFLDLLSAGSFVPRDWLRDPHLVMPAVMLFSIWQGAGFQMLVFLAGLQSIPGDLYEAAALDGAGAWAQFRHVTLPLLRPTLVFVLVTTTIQALQLFTQVQIIAQGGASAPVNSFRTMVMLLVHEGFQRGRIGYASALSVVFFLLVLGLSGLQRRVLRGEER
jgi:multiple sugar transport system permease protein